MDSVDYERDQCFSCPIQFSPDGLVNLTKINNRMIFIRDEQVVGGEIFLIASSRLFQDILFFNENRFLNSFDR